MKNTISPMTNRQKMLVVHATTKKLFMFHYTFLYTKCNYILNLFCKYIKIGWAKSPMEKWTKFMDR